MKKFLFILSFMAIGFVAEAKNGVVKNNTVKSVTNILKADKKVSPVDESCTVYGCGQSSSGNIINFSATAADCESAYSAIIAVMIQFLQ
jgi:hypothetical protein